MERIWLRISSRLLSSGHSSSLQTHLPRRVIFLGMRFEDKSPKLVHSSAVIQELHRLRFAEEMTHYSSKENLSLVSISFRRIISPHSAMVSSALAIWYHSINDVSQHLLTLKPSPGWVRCGMGSHMHTCYGISLTLTQLKEDAASAQGETSSPPASCSPATCVEDRWLLR